MDTEKKRLLEQKKARLRAMRKDAERREYKDTFAKEITLFDQKYRYAETAEAIRIENFLQNFILYGLHSR